MRRLIIGAVALAALGGGLFLWWYISLLPVDSSRKTPVSFSLSRGDGVREIANKLKSANLIRDQVAFFLLVKKLGLEKNIQAGSFSLTPAMSAAEIAKKLTFGTEDVWVTIPEGWRSEEIQEYLKKQNIPGPEGVWDEEGKYFPETYLVPKNFTIDSFRRLMRETFDAKAPEVTKERLIIASIVEREAKYPQDRPLIASVIYNRLDAGMKLDIDATVQYALGYWKKDLTFEDLAVKSSHNTYLNPGLPPGPISNPGLASIQAAVSPAQTDYLYYVADKTGTSHFAKTLQEHSTNIAKYLGP